MGSFNLTFIESLVAAGVPRDRAQTLSEQLREEIDARYSLHAQVIATKRDLAELELKLMKEHARTNERISQSNERISQLETSLRSEINEVKLKIAESNERIANIGAQIAESKVETLKWTAGFMLAQSGMLFAAIKYAA